MNEALEQRMVEALERSAIAQEELIRLATEERDFGDTLEHAPLPQCPHCGVIDPETTSRPGEGRMSEFVLATHCGSCGKPFYAIPTGWHVTGDKEEAKQLIERQESDDSNGT